MVVGMMFPNISHVPNHQPDDENECQPSAAISAELSSTSGTNSGEKKLYQASRVYH